MQSKEWPGSEEVNFWRNTVHEKGERKNAIQIENPMQQEASSC